MIHPKFNRLFQLPSLHFYSRINYQRLILDCTNQSTAILTIQSAGIDSDVKDGLQKTRPAFARFKTQELFKNNNLMMNSSISVLTLSEAVMTITDLSRALLRWKYRVVRWKEKCYTAIF